MLAAHLVPGYFAAAKTQPYWRPEWSKAQRILLWCLALGSTALPDADVIYNLLFRGLCNHSVLWTHSLFIHLAIALCWWVLYRIRRWPYTQTILGLVAVGGLSHLVLDVISHGTPLFYPFSLALIGYPPARVVEGGVLAYLTDPVFLLEPALLALATTHWVLTRPSLAPLARRLAAAIILSSLILFGAAFLFLLPMLQHAAAHL